MEWKAVSHVMTSSVETIAPDAPVTDAARAMIDNNVGSLVIVDEENYPQGIITRTDIVKFVADHESVTEGDVPSVRSKMTTDVVTVSRNDPFQEAVSKMLSNDIHHLPVVQDGKLVGIVTTTDLGTVFSSAR